MPTQPLWSLTSPDLRRSGCAMRPETGTTPLKADVAVIGTGSGGLTAALLAA